MYFIASPFAALIAASAALIASSAGFLSLAQAAANRTRIINPIGFSHFFILFLLQSWDSKFLPHFDQVGVLQRIPVCFEDFCIKRAVPVVGFSNLPKSIPFLHLVPLRGVPSIL